MALMMNEKIKASEVELTGLQGEALGIMPTSEALKLAKQAKADLVCSNIFTSPPPCKLVSKGMAKQEMNKQNSSATPKKVKEIRLTAKIEDHDYETKLRQTESLLQSGHPVLLSIKVQGKEAATAKSLLESMLQELKAVGRKETGIQVSGKQVNVTVLPL